MNAGKKLRYSRQREMIYRYLQSTEDHPTAEMVYNALKQEIQGLSLGTVYRNLNLLVELGKVRKVAAYEGSERYDAICGDHTHFFCQGCGMIRDIMPLEADKVRKAINLGEGYQLSKLDLVLSGLCPRCAQQNG